MDKETLSNYGWIVICVLVLAVMLALATPFGKFISGAIENTTTALFQTSKAGLGSAGIDAGELVFGKQDGGAENPDTPYVPIVRSGIIPDGATYTPNGGTALVGNGTNTFPNTPQTGDTYEEGDYIYKYNQCCEYINHWYSDPSQNGWGVGVKDTSKTSYDEILSEIAGQPVTSMRGTFLNCTSLTTAPTIPNSVKNMTDTFLNCESLTTAPTIPNSVTNMFGTFSGCTSLKTAPTIPNSVTSMSNTFSGCTSLKTYVGSTDADGDFSNYIIPDSVTDMEGTFGGCTALTTAPTIPSSVTNMSYTFNGCTSLTKAPTIPNSVTKMESTFESCTSLKGTIEINANPTCYNGCFGFTTEPITLRGSSPILTELAGTSYRGNVTVG